MTVTWGCLAPGPAPFKGFSRRGRSSGCVTAQLSGFGDHAPQADGCASQPTSNLTAEGLESPSPGARISDDDVKAAFDTGEGPGAVPAEPLGKDETFEQLAEREKTAEDRQEALIDESLDESFPASDPPSAKYIT